jgi:hypothetical protein
VYDSSRGSNFQSRFFLGVGSSCCLVAGVLAELWKYHRRISHLSFNLLSRLSGLGLVRGLLFLGLLFG